MADRYVALSGDDDTGDGSLANPWQTISYGVSQLAAGDTLYIRGGSYPDARIFEVDFTDTGTDFSTGAITIASYPAETAVLNLVSSGDNAVRFQDSSVHHIILDRLVFDGVNGASGSTLVYCGPGSHHIRLHSCTVRNARDHGTVLAGSSHEWIGVTLHDIGLSATEATGGHGIYVTSSDTLIDGCAISTTANYGIHAYSSGSFTDLDNLVVRNNWITGCGTMAATNMGMTLGNGHDIQCYNNLVYNNRGGIQVYYKADNAFVAYNTVYANTPYPGIALQGYETAPTVRNNIVYNNADTIVDYGGVSGTPVVDHNWLTADGDPEFVNAGADNFHLQGTSDCRDAGVDVGIAIDALGVSRPQGSGFDIGAYEYAQAPSPGLTENLMAFWECEEGSGTRVDAHGSNDLAPTNTPGNASGRVGNALDLEFGNSQYLSLADNAALSVGDIDFTFAVWVWVESTDAVNILNKSASDGTSLAYQLQFLTSPNRFRWRVASGDGFANLTAVSTTTTVNTGQWYFLVVWHDATADTLNIQVNNGTAESTGYTFGGYDDTGTFFVGTWALGLDNFDGLIDQVGFWKRTLTTDEKTYLYNSGAGRSYAEVSSTTLLVWLQDTVRISDLLTVEGAILLVSTQEGLRIADTLTIQGGELAVSVQEAVRLSHTITVQGAILLVSLVETLPIADSVTAVESFSGTLSAAPVETMHLQDGWVGANLLLSASQEWLTARSDVARSGATRSGDYVPSVTVTLIGGDLQGTVIQTSLRIRQVLNDEPDTATFTLKPNAWAPPLLLSHMAIYYGGIMEFAGQVIRTTRRRLSAEKQPFVDVECVDWMRLFNKSKVLYTWTNASATTIAQDIIAYWTAGFTADGIEQGLPVIESFVANDEDPSVLFRRLVSLIGGGGFWISPTRSVRLFGTNGDQLSLSTPPVMLENGLSTLKTFSHSYDGTQIRTLVWVNGRTTDLLITIPAGEGSVGSALQVFGFPVRDALGFSTAGGFGGYLKMGDLFICEHTGTSRPGSIGNIPSQLTTADAAIGANQVAFSPGGADALIIDGATWFTDGEQFWCGKLTSGVDAIHSIPTSGYGSIRAPIPSGTIIYMAHALTLITLPSGLGPTAFGTLPWDVPAGTSVRVRAGRYSPDLGGSVGAIEGGSGIHEHLIEAGEADRDGCQAIADAEIAAFSEASGWLEAEWETTDMNAKPGLQQAVNITGGGDPITATLIITEVDITFPLQDHPPWRRCRASDRKALTIADALKDAAMMGGSTP